MLKQLAISGLLSLIIIMQLNASSGDFGKEEIPLKVNSIWYSIPPGHFLYENDDAEITFAEAMRQCDRLEFMMEKGEKLALSSDVRDHPHGVRFLLMLVPCNGYRVENPPLLSQVLDACERLRVCKPLVPGQPIKKLKEAPKDPRRRPVHLQKGNDGMHTLTK